MDNEQGVQLKPELIAGAYQQRVRELEDELMMARAYIAQLVGERKTDGD